MNLGLIKSFILCQLVLFYIVTGINHTLAINSTKIKKMKEDQLISREILFGNPDHVGTKISEDGKNISFLASKNGVSNIWVAASNSPNKVKAITDEKSRGIRKYFWSKNNDYIVYAQDKKGDENWRLYSVNIKTLKQKILTPTDGVRASVLQLSSNFPNKMLVQLNDKVPEYFDIYRIDVSTGKRELVYENKKKYSQFVGDDNLNIRIGYKMLPSGEGEIYLFEDGNTEKPKLFQKIGIEDMLTTAPLHISNDGKKLFMIDSVGKNTSALTEVDLKNFEKKTIHSDSRADIDDYLVDTKTKRIQAVAVNYMYKEWTIVDSDIKRDFDYLKTIDEGEIEIISRTKEDDKWIVVFLKSNSPYRYYLYDRQKVIAKFLFVSNSKQENMPFSKMYPVLIKSRDGLELVSYLTIPRWLDAGTGIPIKPLPLVLNVHGGPNAKDSYGFSAIGQWLANRGYAVLNVNYRGSTGFGKKFINAGDGEWGRKMQDDLADAVQWTIDKKITKKSKVVIMGGSYGGYAALVGMTMTSDMYVAGIDIVGPSNLETLLNSIPPYWKPHLARLTKIIGASPETEEGKKFLKERSPLTYVKNIKKPLLIVQGANDPRVKQAESDQIIGGMKKYSIPVVYLLYSDEGHGLARPENRISMYAHLEMFLAKFAGGRFIPHNGEFPGSSIEVKEGKDITTGRLHEV